MYAFDTFSAKNVNPTFLATENMIYRKHDRYCYYEGLTI